MTTDATSGRACRRRALAVAALAAVALAAPGQAAAATTSQASGKGATTIRLAGPAARALRADGVRLSASGGARANARRIVLPVARASRSRGATELVHRGRVVLRTSDGSARLTSLRTRVGATASAVSARLGRRRVALFSIRTGRGTVDATDGRVSADGATVRLTAPGARALGRALGVGLRSGVLGRAGVSARIEAPPAPRDAPAPAPRPTTPAPSPTPPAPTPPAPTPPAPTPPTPPTPPAPPTAELCPATLPAPVPAVDGNAIWAAKRSWIDYLDRFWGFPGPPSTGCVIPSDGASQVDRYTYQWTYAGADASTRTVRYTGTLEYRQPAHYIATRITNPTFVIAADGRSARMIASGQSSGSRDEATEGAPEITPFTDLHLLDLDLSRATFDGTLLRDAPATVAASAAAADVLSYASGEEYGAFTLQVPAG